LKRAARKKPGNHERRAIREKGWGRKGGRERTGVYFTISSEVRGALLLKMVLDEKPRCRQRTT